MGIFERLGGLAESLSTPIGQGKPKGSRRQKGRGRGQSVEAPAESRGTVTASAEEVLEEEVVAERGGGDEPPRTPAEMRKEKGEAAEEKAEQLTEEPNKVLLRWIAKLGAGIVTGLGLTGLVTLIGSAVLWERFNQAGLPATQALDVVPDSQLTIEGASMMIGALLLGALAVAVLFSLDREGQITRASAWALALLWVGGMAWAIWGEDLDRVPVILGLGTLGLVLIGASVGVAKVTGKLFVPFALAIFVSTIAWSGVLNFAKAAQENYAQPAAVLRSPGGEGIRGFYVADDEETIYLGVLRPGYPPDRSGDELPLYSIARDDDTRLLIGKTLPYLEAVDESKELQKKLVAKTAKKDGESKKQGKKDRPKNDRAKKGDQ